MPQPSATRRKRIFTGARERKDRIEVQYANLIKSSTMMYQKYLVISSAYSSCFYPGEGGTLLLVEDEARIRRFRDDIKKFEDECARQEKHRVSMGLVPMLDAILRRKQQTYHEFRFILDGDPRFNATWRNISQEVHEASKQLQFNELKRARRLVEKLRAECKDIASRTSDLGIHLS